MSTTPITSTTDANDPSSAYTFASLVELKKYQAHVAREQARMEDILQEVRIKTASAREELELVHELLIKCERREQSAMRQVESVRAENAKVAARVATHEARIEALTATIVQRLEGMSSGQTQVVARPRHNKRAKRHCAVKIYAFDESDDE